MKLIIVDGLDGVGKNTHANLIKKKYEKQGLNVVIRSHPESDNFFGRKAKKALLGFGKINKISAAVFYMFDVLRSVRMYYNRDDIDVLVMVRYLMGTAYLPKSLYKIGYSFFEKMVPTSTHMFFLDSPPEILYSRLKERKKIEIFETFAYLQKVRQKALDLTDNWYVIDASGSIDDTYNFIDIVLDRLNQ